jgi:tetratricopeptide (TPR) repeat protein
MAGTRMNGAGMQGRIAVAVMALLLLLYLALVTQLAVRLIAVENLVAKVLGIALIILPLIGVWALWSELAFGFRTERLIGVLRDSDLLPIDTLPKRASGRPDRAAADAEFPKYKAEVEADPDSWQAWFRLGLAYDASGDRTRARRALRRAIALERSARD